MGFTRLRTSVVGVAAGALLLAACSSSSTSEGSGSAESAAAGSGSAAATSAPVNDELATQLAEFAALSPADQEKQLAAASLAAELALVPESDAEAYTAVTSAIVTQAMAYVADPTFGKFGAGPVRTEAMGYGGMLFAGWMMAGIGIAAAVNGSNSLEAGAPAESLTRKDASDSFSSEMNFSGSVENASIDLTITSAEKGVTGRMRVKGTVNPCPDVGGRFTAKVSILAAGNSSTESVGTASNVDISLQGLVNDNAEIIGYETTTNTKAKSGSRGQLADVTLTTQNVGESSKLTGYQDNGASGGDATQTRQWSNLGIMTEMMVVAELMKSIKKAIESGRCVKLTAVTTPAKTTGLPVSSTVSISAQPRSKVDGKPTGGTVTGTLNGGASLDPAGTKVPADATFTYAAPDKENQGAAVLLEARSLRGVGRAEVPMNTMKPSGYVISETVGEFRYEGKSCGSITGPWTIRYTLLGNPDLDWRGTYSLTFPSASNAGSANASVSGKGTEKGSVAILGVSAGGRYTAPLTATLTTAGSEATMVVTAKGGSGFTWSPNAGPRRPTPKSQTIELHPTPASADACPTR